MDQELANTYIGKHLLIGVTYLDHEDNFIEQKQFHGNIVRINDKEGIVLRVHESNEEFKLPPDLKTLQKAPKGEYRLQATNEIVVDPDFLTTWTLNKANPDE